MRYRVALIGIGIIAILGVGIALLMYLLSSLWFLYSLIPNTNNAEVVWGAQNAQFPFKREIEAQLVGNSYTESFRRFSRYVFVQKTDAEVLVALPRLKDQIKASEHLLRAGWKDVKRIGPVIYAINGENITSNQAETLFTGLIKLWLYIAQSNHTKQPLAITYIQEGKYPLFNDSYAAILSFNGNRYELYGEADQVLSPLLRRQDSSITVAEGSFDLYLDIPTHITAKTPSLIQSLVESDISKRLGFETTILNLFASNQTFSRLIVARNGDNLALAIPGNEGNLFFETELKKEYGYNHPEQKAFRLPDGSIGFELVAGEEHFNVEAIPSDPTCVLVHQSLKNIFLCKRNGLTILATSLNVITALEEKYMTKEDGWIIQLSSIYRDKLPYLEGFESLVVTGNGNLFRLVTSIDSK